MDTTTEILVKGGLSVLALAVVLMTPSFEMIYGLMSWALLIFFLVWMAPDVVDSVRELSAKWREA